MRILHRAIGWLQLAYELAEQLEVRLRTFCCACHRGYFIFYEMKVDTVKVIMDRAHQLVQDKTDYASRKHSL